MTAQATPFRSLLVITLAFLPSGCDEPLPTEAAHEESAAIDRVPAGGTQPDGGLPFHVRGVGTLIRQSFAPDFGPPTFGKSTFDGRCSVPSDFLIRFSIEAEATHLGRLKATAEHCSVIDFRTGAGAIHDGALTFIAANGDQLWDHYQGHVIPPGGAATESHSFWGGTGRFAGATGEATSHVACDRAAGTCVLELDGVLDYDASNRSR